MPALKILIATFNPGKFREIGSILQKGNFPLELHSLADLNIDTSYAETGSTFEENARGKSVFYSDLVPDMLTVAEDSGLVVDGLDGEPGVYSARYAGEGANDQKNIKKLLTRMENRKNRAAAFVAVVAISKNGTLMNSFEGKVEGTILNKQKGANGFGYDPIFYYPRLKKTFAELTTEEKNKISHRAQAFQQLKLFLLDLVSF